MIRGGSALCALAAGLALLPTCAAAQSEQRLSADLSVSAGYSNNPFAVIGTDTDSALVSVNIAPRYEISTERSTLEVAGAANVQQYARRYGRNDSYSGAIDYRLRPDERLTLHTRLDLSSAVLGAFNNFIPGASSIPTVGTGVGGDTGTGIGTGGGGALTPAPSIGLIPPTDVSLFGLRNRRRLGRLSGDVDLGVSDRDAVIVGAYAELARFGTLSQFGDYDAYGVSLGYSRQISSGMTVGLRGSASSFDYQSDNGSTRVFPVEATVSGRFSQLWRVDAALGVTIVDSASAGSTRQTSVSGNIELCRRGELSTTCFQAARRVTPTGLVGAQYVVSAGFNWSLRLSERENLTVGASYSDVGGGNDRSVSDVLPLQDRFAQALVGYDRRISQRLRFVASANYRRLIGMSTGQPDDFGGQVGLAYRFGDTR